jgi:N-acyl amino acid synthase of PEP-CTERM/exosortase system
MSEARGLSHRHDVYCKELAYEPMRPDSMETDAYDAHSAHCLLRSKANDEYVGCIRLVFARPDDPLPVEQLCAATIDRTLVDPAKIPRDKARGSVPSRRDQSVSATQRRDEAARRHQQARFRNP